MKNIRFRISNIFNTLFLIVAFSSMSSCNKGEAKNTPEPNFMDKTVHVSENSGRLNPLFSFKDLYETFQNKNNEWYKEDEYWVLKIKNKNERTHKTDTVMAYFMISDKVKGNIIASRLVAGGRNLSSQEIYQSFMYFSEAVRKSKEQRNNQTK